jgi:hypothetical protein
MTLWERLCNWFARRSPAYAQLEREVVELERRVLLLDTAVDYPLGTLALAESKALEVLAGYVPAHVQVVALPTREGRELSVGQLGIQLVEGRK